jgi:mannose-6-phosphate isomerase-like protein (cupin superfamily)
VEVGEVFANPRSGAMVEITKWPGIARSDGEVQIRRVLRPGMGFRLPHVHLSLDETFYVEYGVADIRIGHRSGRLCAGEQFRVPRYDVHVNPRNRSTSDLVLLQTFEAARTDGPKRYVETLAKFIREGRDVHGDIPPLVAAAVFAGKDQQTFAPWLPHGLQRTVVFPLAKSFEERRHERRRLRAADAAAGEDNWADW